MKTFTFQDQTIMLGENAQENWDLVSQVNIDYWWFHLGSYPSGHLVFCSTENKLSKEAITECARLCKEHTKYRNLRLRVEYTRVKNLRKGKAVGEVYYRRGKEVFSVVI